MQVNYRKTRSGTEFGGASGYPNRCADMYDWMEEIRILTQFAKGLMAKLCRVNQAAVDANQAAVDTGRPLINALEWPTYDAVLNLELAESFYNKLTGFVGRIHNVMDQVKTIALGAGVSPERLALL
jgi:hypothetical protein